MRYYRTALASLSLLAACSAQTSGGVNAGDVDGSGSGDTSDAGGDAFADASPADVGATDVAEADVALVDAGDADSVGTDAIVAADSDSGAVDVGGPDDVASDAGGPSCIAVPPFPALGELIAPIEGTHSSTLDLCRGEVRPFVAAADMRWYVRVEGVPDGTVVRIHDAFTADLPDRVPLFEGVAAGGEVATSLATLRAGEHRVDVVPPQSVGDVDYRIVFRCDDGCARETTRYPIVLVHGYAGVDSYFGVLDYFFDVVPTLADYGYSAFTPVTSPIATSERRAEQLDEQLKTIMQETGADRLNIIAHSQGGLDARVLVSGRGWDDRIASITTVATPHGGIPLLLADFISVQDFSPDYMVEFNDLYKDSERVRYWSWSSRSCGILEPGCRRESDNELVDVILGASYTLLLRFGENDGVVPTASMAWGENLGMIFADHFDEVGQIADGSPDDDPFDHRAFYLSEARRLRDAGL